MRRLIASGCRDATCTRDRAALDPVAEMLDRKPAAIILSRRPRFGARRRRADDRSRDLRERGADPGHLLRAPVVAMQLGGEVAKTGRGEYVPNRSARCHRVGLFHDQPSSRSRG